MSVALGIGLLLVASMVAPSVGATAAARSIGAKAVVPAPGLQRVAPAVAVAPVVVHVEEPQWSWTLFCVPDNGQEQRVTVVVAAA